MVRPQGLVTLSTAYAPRSLAGFVSRQQRSWDSLFGAFPSHKVSQAFPPSRTHIPFFLRLRPPPTRRAGPVRRGSWALALARVPGDRRGFKAPTTGCSLELHPSRAFQRQPWRRFRTTSSHVLRSSVLADDPAPRSLDQFPLGLVHISAASRKRWNKATLLGFCTHTIPYMRANRRPGYVFT
jgi:hypothetical protein